MGHLASITHPGVTTIGYPTHDQGAIEQTRRSMANKPITVTPIFVKLHHKTPSVHGGEDVNQQNGLYVQYDMFNPVDTGATFSPCRAYRYTLWRQWGEGAACCALMLNPSTADETVNDPTVERMEKRVRALPGFGTLFVTNIFAFRATDPAQMKSQQDPIGPENDAAILSIGERSDLIVCAWGSHGGFRERSRAVVSLLKENDLWEKVRILKLTKSGEPQHPLYIAYDTPFSPWGD